MSHSDKKNRSTRVPIDIERPRRSGGKCPSTLSSGSAGSSAAARLADLVENLTKFLTGGRAAVRWFLKELRMCLKYTCKFATSPVLGRRGQQSSHAGRLMHIQAPRRDVIRIDVGEVAKRLCTDLQRRSDGFDSRPRLQTSHLARQLPHQVLAALQHWPSGIP